MQEALFQEPFILSLVGFLLIQFNWAAIHVVLQNDNGDLWKEKELQVLTEILLYQFCVNLKTPLTEYTPVNQRVSV